MPHPLDRSLAKPQNTVGYDFFRFVSFTFFCLPGQALSVDRVAVADMGTQSRGPAKDSRPQQPQKTGGCICGGAGSGQSFHAGERPLAAPLIIFAQLGLVFFYLGFQIAERFLAAGSHG